MLTTEPLHLQVKHSAAYQGPGQLAQWRTPDSPESQLRGQSSTARHLLQEQSQQQVASNTLPDVAAAHDSAAAGHDAAATAAAAAAAAAAEARPEGNPQADMLPSSIQQYQPSSMPFVNEDRLISAAVTQASQLMGETVGKYEGEDQFDVWPLVNPPFQEALHEVSQATPSSKQCHFAARSSLKIPILLQCFGSSKLHRVCKYYNLLLWNGTLYYPTTGDHLLKSVHHI